MFSLDCISETGNKGLEFVCVFRNYQYNDPYEYRLVFLKHPALWLDVFYHKHLDTGELLDMQYGGMGCGDQGNIYNGYTSDANNAYFI